MKKIIVFIIFFSLNNSIFSQEIKGVISEISGKYILKEIPASQKEIDDFISQGFKIKNLRKKYSQLLVVGDQEYPLILSQNEQKKYLNKYVLISGIVYHYNKQIIAPKIVKELTKNEHNSLLIEYNSANKVKLEGLYKITHYQPVREVSREAGGSPVRYRSAPSLHQFITDNNKYFFERPRPNDILFYTKDTYLTLEAEIDNNILKNVKIIYIPRLIQESSVKKETLNNMECTSSGIGKGINNEIAKENAKSNRVKSLKTALIEGHYSFSNESGSGCAICEKNN